MGYSHNAYSSFTVIWFAAKGVGGIAWRSVVSNRSAKMLFTNVRFRELWGIPKTMELDEEGRALMQFAISKVVDPKAFVDLIERLHATDEIVEDQIELKDGTVLRRRTVSVNDFFYGRTRVWIFTEVKN